MKSVVCRNVVVESGCTLKYCLVMENTVVPQNYSATNCLLRGAGDTFEAISWQNQIDIKPVELETEELFVEEVEEGQNF